jgi:hypothetical protein
VVIASRPSPSDRGVTAGANPSVTLIVVCVGYFLVLLDVTIVNVALPDMRADLAAGVDAWRSRGSHCSPPGRSHAASPRASAP